MELRYLINDRVKTENKVRRVGAVLTNHSHIEINYEGNLVITPEIPNKFADRALVCKGCPLYAPLSEEGSPDVYEVSDIICDHAWLKGNFPNTVKSVYFAGIMLNKPEVGSCDEGIDPNSLIAPLIDCAHCALSKIKMNEMIARIKREQTEEAFQNYMARNRID